MKQVKLERLNSMTAACTHAIGAAPEEDALKKILQFAQINDLVKADVRLFGRNTYPTDAPEPHGYEYYLTVNANIQPSNEVAIKQVPGGLYAVYTVKNLFNLVEGWKQLFAWIESSGYEPVGVSKGEHGWVNNAFEELVNWQSEKPPTEWVFNLWVQLKNS